MERLMGGLAIRRPSQPLWQAIRVVHGTRCEIVCHNQWAMLIIRFWDYLVAAGLYWWTALAVLLGIERVAERYFHDFWQRRVDPWITPETRKRILIALALIAFVIGNFRAYEAEREAKEQAIAGRLKPVLDPDIIYQDHFPIASTIEPTPDIAANTLTFPAVTASRNLNLAKEFEFRTWKLLCSGEPAGSMTFGAMRQITYPKFVCRIEGLR
jgi:hypothetical protein